MSKFPHGWSSETMGKLADFVMGQAPPGSECNKTENGTPFVKAGEFGVERPVIREWTTRPLKHALASDVLICVVGATAGKINLGADCAIGRSVAAVRPSNALDQDFLFRFLSTKVQDLRAGSAGSAQGVISKDDLAEVQMALPPLPEQRRIVAKIDSLTGKSKRARDHIDHIPRLVEKYKQAILAAAFQGDLTREWRAEHRTEWRGTNTLSELCASVTDGDHQAPPKAASGIPFITISAMNDGTVDLQKATRFVHRTYLDGLGQTRRASRGDVLYSVTGSFGIAALVDFDDPFVFQRHIAILKPNPELLDAAFLFRMLSCLEVVRQADAAATGTAQRTVPLSGLRQFSIPAPTMPEQHEIVRKIDAVFSWIDRLAAEATSARKLIDRLDHAVLAKAFRGELVPQDPADEPADVLLARIRAERAEASPFRRRRAGGQSG